MKRSHLLILVVSAAVLLVVFLALRERGAPSGTVRPAHDVLGSPLDVSAIGAIRVRAGGGEGAGTLTLTDQDGTWWVQEGEKGPRAPADKSWVDQLLDSLRELDKGGEVRAMNPDVQRDFRVTDADGVHLEVLDHDGKVLHDLIVGKRTSDWTGTFVRRKGSKEIVLVRTALRQRLRLRGGDEKPEVNAAAWWKLKLFDLELGDVARLEVEGPDAAARVVERKETPPAEAQADAGKAGEGAEQGGGEAEEEKKAPPAQPPPPTFELAGGKELDDPSALVRSLVNARASKVAPPEAETGFGEDAKPSARILVKTKDGRDLALEFGAEVPDMKGARYVRLDSESVVYVLPSYTVKSLLEPGEKEKAK